MASRLPALVICGGHGTRLREVTGDRIPKALVAVAGGTLLDRTLGLLARAGIEEAVLVTGHHGDQIERHVRVHSPRLPRIRLVRCDPPRGIVQDVTAACDAVGIEGPCWLTGCDELVDALDLEGARRLHDARGAVVTTLVARGVAMIDRSVDAVLDGQGRITALLPPAEAPGRCSVIGISLLSPAFLARARALPPAGATPDRDRLLRQVLPALIAEGGLYGALVTPDYYFHAGTPAALARAEAHFAAARTAAAAGQDHSPR